MVIPLHPAEVPEDFLCPICLALPRDPWTVKRCGHVFCKGCIQQSFSTQEKAGWDRSCPICRSDCSREHDLVSLKTESPLSFRIWSKIAVKCEHYDEGCKWTGSISDYESHYKSCPCRPNQNNNKKCGRYIERFRGRCKFISDGSSHDFFNHSDLSDLSDRQIIQNLEEEIVQLKSDKDEERVKLKSDRDGLRKQIELLRSRKLKQNVVQAFKGEIVQLKSDRHLLKSENKVLSTLLSDLNPEWQEQKRNYHNLQHPIQLCASIDCQLQGFCDEILHDKGVAKRKTKNSDNLENLNLMANNGASSNRNIGSVSETTKLENKLRKLARENSELLHFREESLLWREKLSKASRELGKLKNSIASLEKPIPNENGDGYAYDLSNVVELTQLICKNVLHKPSEIDANEIFDCVMKIGSDLFKQCSDDGPDDLYADVRMLLAVCMASTWFTKDQKYKLGATEAEIIVMNP